MKDTMFKQSIRYFVRSIIWLIKLCFAPIHLFVHVVLMGVNFFFMSIHWAYNNEKYFEEVKNKNRQHWQGIVEWYTP